MESNETIVNFSTSLIGDSLDDYLILNKKAIEKIDRTNIKHELSHQTLYISFWKLELNTPIINGIKISDIDNYPFPVPIKNFINNYINAGDWFCILV